MTYDASPSGFETHLKRLWLSAQSGDEDAYRNALELMSRRLRGYLRHRMRGFPADVEDVVQETLLAVHLQRSTYDPALPVSAWVVAIAHHKLIDLWRKRGRGMRFDESLDDVDDMFLVAAPDASEAKRDLEKLMNQLPEAQRRAIFLTKVDGLSIAEASERTGSSPSAIKVQVHRGLKRLAQMVKGQG